MAAMHSSSRNLHPDYGPAGGGAAALRHPVGGRPADRPLVAVGFKYGSESNAGPYPLSASTPIEGGSDRHAIMVHPSTCKLYELFDTHYTPGNGSTAGSGAIWTLTSNALRKAGWTSADAAGLPILPGLVNYDEVIVRRDEPRHPGDRRLHVPAPTSGPPATRPGRPTRSCPPMGTRFRLRASFTLPGAQCAPTARRSSRP